MNLHCAIFVILTIWFCGYFTYFPLMPGLHILLLSLKLLFCVSIYSNLIQSSFMLFCIFKISFSFASILMETQKKLVGIHIKWYSIAVNKNLSVFSTWALFHILCDVNYRSSKVYLLILHTLCLCIHKICWKITECQVGEML